MPALQRTEAEDRARLLTVHSYAVALDVTGERTFRSTAVIRFDCAEPGASSWIEVEPEALLRAELNGRPLDPASLDGNRLPLPELAAGNELLVEADMAYSRTAEGLHRFTDPADGADYVYACCGPDLAPKVFACFDQPDLKAEFAFTVTAPADWTVIGNGASSRLADGRWEVAPVGRISSYLVTVVGGPLHAVHAEHDGIPLGLYARRSLAAELDREAPELFEVTRASLDRLHELFEERYPFGRYDQAFVPEFNWGAMENPGCVVFQDRMLFRATPSDAERASRAMVICHEMAHMWFGDLVTLAWWDDVWLNESFAEMLGYRIAAEATRHTNAWTLFSRRKNWGYDADQRPTTHPVAATATASVADALANFDGISYAKGAGTLRQLVHWLGDEAFFAGLNAYFAEHRWGNASLADFLAALGPASGRDVPAWADSWLRTTGVDTLRIEVESDPDGVLRSVALVNEGSRPHRVRVGVHDREGEAIVPRARLDVDVAPGGRTPLPELAGTARPVLLMPNDGDLSWARFRLDPHSAATMAASLSAVTDELTRSMLWEHARDLTRSAELPAHDYLRLVTDHLPHESSDDIVSTVLTFALDHVIARYLAPADRPAALAAVGAAARSLLDHPGMPQGVRLTALRGVLAAATGPQPLAELAGWLDGEKLPHGLPFDSDLRWAALARLAAAGAADEQRIAAELATDPSDRGASGAARARAALPDEAAKERAWQLLFTPDTLSNELLTATATGFWRSGTPDLHQTYVRRYFAQLPSAAPRGGSVARALAQTLFPSAAADPETIAAAEACLARDDLSAPLRRHLADELDDLRRAAAHRPPSA